MNNLSKKKINDNEGSISKIVMGEILKKNSLLHSESNINNKIIIPSFMSEPDEMIIFPISSLPSDELNFSDEIKKNDSIRSSNSTKSNSSIQSTDHIEKMESIKSVDSIKSSISTKSTQSTQSTNSSNFLLNSVINNSPESLISSALNHKNKKKYKNAIFNEIIYGKTNIIFNDNIVNSDSELITDTNTVINFSNNVVNTDFSDNIDSIKTPESNYHILEDDFVILSNLTLLSKIQPNQKLIITPTNKNNSKSTKINFEIKIDESYVPLISRWYYKQGRNETIVALSELIDVSIEQFILHKNSNNNINMKKYIDLLAKTKIGLENLKITYESDALVGENIDKIINKINNCNII